MLVELRTMSKIFSNKYIFIHNPSISIYCDPSLNSSSSVGFCYAIANPIYSLSRTLKRTKMISRQFFGRARMERNILNQWWILDHQKQK